MVSDALSSGKPWLSLLAVITSVHRLAFKEAYCMTTARIGIEALPPVTRLCVIFVLAPLLMTSPAMSDETAATADTQKFPDLYKMYYDGGLLEYCNLISPLAGKGFREMRTDLLARDKPTEEEHRQARIAAATAVDNEYLDHGLSGQRIWCRTDGQAAFQRFEAYGAKQKQGGQ